MRAAAVLNDVNWCALGLTILNEKFTVERALDHICGIEQKYSNRSDLTEADTLDMIKIRDQGMTYKELGEMYGICEGAMHKRIKRYKERLMHANSKTQF